LRIFRAVAEAGGLTAAEGILGMERSTISRHLQALETRLGARLCFRGPAGFELTEFGMHTHRASLAASDALETIRQELNLARDRLTGELRIGIADNCLSNPHSPLAGVLGRFRNLASEVKLNLSVGIPADLVGGLLERRFHLTICGQPPVDHRLDHQSLFIEEFRLAIAAGDQAPCELNCLRDRGFVLVTRKGERRTQALARQLGLDRIAVASGLEAVATMIAGGGFVGFLPAHYAEMLAPLYPLQEVVGAEPLRYAAQFSLIWAVNRPLPPSGRLLQRLLSEADGGRLSLHPRPTSHA
jgi:DNA-binding transcriptional LysR family regulator